MNLVKFLFIGTVLSVLLGELGRLPFGGSSASITLTDGLLSLTLVFFSIWIVSTKQKILIPTFFKWLTYFWGVAILSLIWSLTQLPITEVLKGGLYLLRFVLYSSTVLIVFNLIQQKIIDKDSLIKLLVAIGTTLSLLGFVQVLIYPNFEDPPFYLTDFGFDPHRGRLTSTFLDPNFFGVFLVINLGLAVYLLIKYPCKRVWVALTVLLAGLILTMSRSAYLALFIFFFLFAFLGRKFLLSRWSILAVVLTFTILLLVPQFQARLKGAVLIDESAGLRFESWWKGSEIAKVNPIIGVGFNNIRSTQQQLNLVQTYSVEGGHSGAGVDSSLLFVLATTGVAGLIIYLVFWVKTLINFRKQNSILSVTAVTIFISIIISSQFINLLFFPPIMLYYFSILGLVYDSPT